VVVVVVVDWREGRGGRSKACDYYY